MRRYTLSMTTVTSREQSPPRGPQELGIDDTGGNLSLSTAIFSEPKSPDTDDESGSTCLDDAGGGGAPGPARGGSAGPASPAAPGPLSPTGGPARLAPGPLRPVDGPPEGGSIVPAGRCGDPGAVDGWYGDRPTLACDGDRPSPALDGLRECAPPGDRGRSAGSGMRDRVGESMPPDEP